MLLVQTSCERHRCRTLQKPSLVSEMLCLDLHRRNQGPPLLSSNGQSKICAQFCDTSSDMTK
jgi:hypothetical protein